MSDKKNEYDLLDRILAAFGFSVIGAIVGMIIGFLSTANNISDILFPWAYIFGGLFAAVAFKFPKIASVFFLILSGCQLGS